MPRNQRDRHMTAGSARANAKAHPPATPMTISCRVTGRRSRSSCEMGRLREGESPQIPVERDPFQSAGEEGEDIGVGGVLLLDGAPAGLVETRIQFTLVHQETRADADHDRGQQPAQQDG